MFFSLLIPSTIQDKSYFHGRPNPIKNIDKSDYLIVDFYLVLFVCGIP